MNLLGSLRVALQFLTRIPVGDAAAPDARTVGYSLLFYPLVGVLIGAVLVALQALLGDTAPLLRAALLLMVWVVITGALHLDGLADSADAWLGAGGDRARALAIMKDPYCGPAGVVSLLVILMVKLAALSDAGFSAHPSDLLLAPLIGRSLIPLLFLTTPYVRPGGLGASLASHAPRRALMGVLVVSLAIVVWLLGVSRAYVVLIALIGFYLLRRLMLQRLGGTTGDTAGALVEIAEMLTLVVLALGHQTANAVIQ